MTFEYEPYSEHYSNCGTIEEIVVVDASPDDRKILFETCDSDIITWEIIE